MSATENILPAPLEPITIFEVALDQKLEDLNSSNSSVEKSWKTIFYIKDENRESKNKLKNYKTSSTILERFENFVNTTTICISVPLSATGSGLILILSSIGIACRLNLVNRVLYERAMIR